MFNYYFNLINSEEANKIFVTQLWAFVNYFKGRNLFFAIFLFDSFNLPNLNLS